MKQTHILKKALLALASTCLAAMLSACGGGDQPEQRNASNASNAPTLLSAQGTVGNAGGSIDAPGVKASFTGHTLQDNTSVVVSEGADPDLQNVFSESAALFGDLKGSETEISVVFDKMPDPNQYMELTVALPEQFTAGMGDGDSVVALVLVRDVSLDAEVAEDHRYFEGVTSVHDRPKKALTITVPLSSLMPHAGGTFKVTVKAAIAPADRPANSARAQPSSVYSQKSTFANPLADTIIVAAFKQPRPAGPHGGTDFRAFNKDVYAMASGHVQMVRVESCVCGKLTSNCDAGNPGFAVTIRHDDGTSVAYRHLMRGSIPGFHGDERCWVQPSKEAPVYPVQAGQKVAVSGSTGTKSPHLHVEYGPHRNSNKRLNRANLFEAFGTLKLAEDQVTFNLINDPIIHPIIVNAQYVEILHKRDSSANGLLSMTAQGSGYESGNDYFALQIDSLITTDASLVGERWSTIAHQIGNFSTDNGEMQVRPTKTIIPDKISIRSVEPNSGLVVDELNIDVRVEIDTSVNLTVKGESETIGTTVKKTYACGAFTCQGTLFCTPPQRKGEIEKYLVQLVVNSRTGLASLDDITGQYQFGTQTLKLARVYPAKEVTPPGSNVKFYSEGGAVVEAVVDLVSKTVTGTITEKVATTWALDGSRAECQSVASFVAKPM